MSSSRRWPRRGRLFGSKFRPGSVASKIAHDPLNFAHVDRALALSIREDADKPSRSGPEAEARGKLTLYIHYGQLGPTVGATRRPLGELLETTAVALCIDPAALWRRIRVQLED